MATPSKPRLVKHDSRDDLAQAALDRERWLLGALLENNELVRLVDLSESDFSTTGHRRLFRYCNKKHEDCQPFDITTASADLRESGELELVGGAAELAELTSGAVAAPDHVLQHAKGIREHSYKRRVRVASQELAEAAANGATPHELAALIGRLNDLTEIDMQGNLLPVTCKQSEKGIEVVCASQVEAVERRYFADGLIPDRTLTLVVGEPKIGKTTVALELVKQVQGAHGKALFLSNEDSASDLRVKFEALGGDVNRLLLGNGDKPWTIDNVAALENTLRVHRPCIAVIDSLSTHSPGKIDLHRHQDAAAVLVPLRMLAEKFGIPIVLLHHLNKAPSTNLLNRVSGSTGIVATGRHTLLVTVNPEAEDERVISPHLSNVAATSGAGRRFIVHPFQWRGKTTVNVADLLMPSATKTGNTAVEFLKSELSQGRKRAEEVYAAGQAKGFSKDQIWRASDKLNELGQLRRVKQGFSGGWAMEMVEGCSEGRTKIAGSPYIQSSQSSQPSSQGD